jgi:hypothetical protein
MSSRQVARRAAYWRGSAITLLFCTFLMLLGALADRITQ